MPHSLDFRARTVAEIVDGAVQLYKRDALHYILIAAVASVPGVVLQIVAAGGGDATSGAEFSGMMMLALLVGVLGWTLMSAVLVHFSSAVYLDGHGDVSASLRAVLRCLPTVVINALIKWLLIILATAFLFAPGAYLFTRWFATTPAIVLEGKGVVSAFGRSAELAKGRKWRILGALLLVYGIFWLGALALMTVTGGFDDHNGVLEQVILAAYSAVAYPIVGIAEMLLYYDARIRGEAYDVEVLARGLPSAPEAVSLPDR